MQGLALTADTAWQNLSHVASCTRHRGMKPSGGKTSSSVSAAIVCRMSNLKLYQAPDGYPTKGVIKSDQASRSCMWSNSPVS